MNKLINELELNTSPAANDSLPIQRASDGETMRVTYGDLIPDETFDGWVLDTGSFVYASDDAPYFTLTVDAGADDRYSAQMLIRLTQTTVKYFIITAVSDTSLTLFGGGLYSIPNDPITDVSLSSAKAPFGFPEQLSHLLAVPKFTTTERDAIASPYEGQTILNTTTAKMNYYNGTDWEVLFSYDKDDENWEDLRFPVQGINPNGAANPPSVDTNDGCLVFSASATNVIAGVAQMPHSWLRESAIKPHIHWQPSSTNTGNVYWRFEYEIQNVNDTFTGSYTTQNTLDPGDGTALKHQVHSLMESGTPITMTGKRESCVMKWRISRMGAEGTDDFTGTAKLLEFDIHYQVGKLGTPEEFPTP